MALENVFYQPSTTEMLAPKIESAGLNFTRDYCFNNQDTVKALIEGGYVLRPEFSDEHPRYRYATIVREIDRLGDRVLIIPQSAGIFPELGSGRIVKKGRLLKLRRVNSIDEAVDGQISPERLLREAFRYVTIDETYVGYDWKGIGETSRNYKVVRLVDCINGMLLHSNSNIEEQLRIKSYDDCQHAIFRGAHAVVDVPSVSKEETANYRVRLSSLPVYNIRLRGRRKPRRLYFATWFDLTSNHGCAKKDYAFQYIRNRREGNEILFDLHDIAAYIRLSEYKKRTGSDTQVMVNPFAKPREETLRYTDKLRTQVLREVVVNGKLRRRPLTQAEQEILLWKLVALRKNAFD